MGDPVSNVVSATTGLIGGVVGGRALKKMLSPDLPDTPDLPPPVQEVDIQKAKSRRADVIKSRKGRQSTILGSSNRGLSVGLG